MNDIPCPVCGHVTRPSSIEGLWRCLTCTHLFQHPLEITAEYNYEYVHDRYESYPTTDAMSHLRLGFVRAFHPKPGRLLDVGYGNGSFLKVAERAGYETFGNDVHGCGEKFGIREVNLNGAVWDVVTFFDSLEHFSSLELPRHVCSQASTVIVSVPAIPEDEKDIPGWKHYRPGEHLHYFTRQSLDAFMHPKVRKGCLNLEDTIRGDRGGQWNVMTAAFVKD